MTFIAEGGGRTVTNASAFDRRKVYEITTVAVLDVVRSEFGSGEVVRTGEKISETIVYHVVAVNERLARQLYEKHWGDIGRHVMTGLKVLFVIDGEISTEYK